MTDKPQKEQACVHCGKPKDFGADTPHPLHAPHPYCDEPHCIFEPQKEQADGCACEFLDHEHGTQINRGCMCCDMNAPEPQKEQTLTVEEMTARINDAIRHGDGRCDCREAEDCWRPMAIGLAAGWHALAALQSSEEREKNLRDALEKIVAMAESDESVATSYAKAFIADVARKAIGR